MSELVAFSDLALAAYCPRKLDYAERREERGPPPRAERVRALAGGYRELREHPDGALADRPLAVSPGEYRRRLDRLAEQDCWEFLSDPAETDVLLEGKDCRGVAAKVGSGPAVSLVSPGEPPENGVWKPQGVKAVAAAKALAWRENEAVERAYVEYPAHAVVRRVARTTRRKAAYRSALRTVRRDPPRTRCGDGAKCSACEYEGECGAASRSLRSLLF